MSDDMFDGLSLDERPPVEAVDQCRSPFSYDGEMRFCSLSRGHGGVHCFDHGDWYITWCAEVEQP